MIIMLKYPLVVKYREVQELIQNTETAGLLTMN